MSVKVRVNWDGDAALRALKNATPDALYRAGEEVRRESNLQAPLDTGALLRSSATQVEGQTATVSYDTPYAVRWHENSANFQRGRKKKYLEDPINDKAVQDRVLRILGDGVGGAFK